MAPLGRYTLYAVQRESFHRIRPCTTLYDAVGHLGIALGTAINQGIVDRSEAHVSYSDGVPTVELFLPSERISSAYDSLRAHMLGEGWMLKEKPPEQLISVRHRTRS